MITYTKEAKRALKLAEKAAAGSQRSLTGPRQWS